PDQTSLRREREYGVIGVFNEFGEESSLFAGDRLGGAQFGQIPDDANRAASRIMTLRVSVGAAAKVASRAIREGRDRNQNRPGQPLGKQFKRGGTSCSYYLRDAACFALCALKKGATTPANQVANIGAFKSGSGFVDPAQDAVVIEYEDPVIESIERGLPLELTVK